MRSGKVHLRLYTRDIYNRVNMKPLNRQDVGLEPLGGMLHDTEMFYLLKPQLTYGHNPLSEVTMSAYVLSDALALLTEPEQ